MDELERQLNKMAEGAEKLEHTTEVTFAELFSKSFISNYTDFSSMDEFFKKIGIKSEDDFREIPDDKLNSFVSKHTVFESFQEFYEEAMANYISRQLGF